jgi:hypothetical protein
VGADASVGLRALDYRRIQRKAVGTVTTPNSSFPYPECSRPVGRFKEISETAMIHLETLLSPFLRESGYQTHGFNGEYIAYCTLETGQFVSSLLAVKTKDQKKPVPPVSGAPSSAPAWLSGQI